MNDNISDKDKKDWQTFVLSKDKLPNKDFKPANKNVLKVRSIDLHGYTLEQANNVKLLLLSATPMYNSQTEIVWLLNLMNVNDGRAKVDVSDIFTKTGRFRESKTGELVGKELLLRKMSGYVSFIRGENPYTFPYRVFPSMVSQNNTLASIEYPNNIKRRLIYLTPSGKPLKQANLLEFSRFDQLIILCGRFEGVDQRAINVLDFSEISIGDYILMGGETAAQVLVEGCIRLLPGVLGQPKSLLEESFSNELTEVAQWHSSSTTYGLVGNVGTPQSPQSLQHKTAHPITLQHSHTQP